MLNGPLRRLAPVCVLATALAPTAGRAQVFLATEESPEFAIGPLFIRATTVSHWETESQEAEIAIGAGVVKDVQVRVRQSRLPFPDAL